MLLSLLLVGGLGALLRWYFGKQRWYVGVAFLVVAFPLSIVGLLGLSLELGVQNPTPGTVGTEAFVGSMVGAFLLSSSLPSFLDAEESEK